MLRPLRYLWATPVTLVGLPFAALAQLTGGRVQLRDGVVEAYGGCLRTLLRGGRIFEGGAALTLGHVIIARNRECLERSRRHEMVHVRQYERWGPLLPFVYAAIRWWLAWRGYDPHLDHPFEKEAYAGTDL
jgi:hypothetical protein